jgi:hypothetical protein
MRLPCSSRLSKESTNTSCRGDRLGRVVHLDPVSKEDWPQSLSALTRRLAEAHRVEQT